MDPKLITVLAVGGNATSAFMSWRLQATNACDVTLVWKNGYESVAQYGISFRYISVLLHPQPAILIPRLQIKVVRQ